MSDTNPDWAAAFEKVSADDSASTPPHQAASPPPAPAAAAAAAAASHGGSSPKRHEAASHDAAVASHGGSSLKSDDETLKRFNADMEEYLVELGLSDLARLFMEEAKKRQGIQSIPFVQTWTRLESEITPISAPPEQSIQSITFMRKWIRLESEMSPISAPPGDKEMEVMIPLNEGIEKYLNYLDIETRSFKEKAWTRAEGGICLIQTWVERIYPQLLMLQELRKIQTGSNLSSFEDKFIHFVCM